LEEVAVPSEKVERYRRKAEDRLRNAAAASDLKSEVMWLEMAQQYLQLADTLEKVSVRGVSDEPSKAYGA
jgi:hypothetical protein